MKGISPLISFVMLVVLTFSLAAIIGPWIYNMATEQSDASRNETDTNILCRDFSYDFDTTYGNYGISWNATSNVLLAKVKNTGNQNVYGFFFELTMNDTVIQHYEATTGTRKSSSNPLRPGQSTVVQADLTQNLSAYNLQKVMVLNGICPHSSPSAVGL